MVDLARTKPITAEDLPSVAPDDQPCELVAGTLVCEPPPGQAHGWVAATILGRLFEHVRRHRLGRVYTAETGFVLAREPDSVRCPDAAFVSAARLTEEARRSLYFEGAPNLAVEVLSPSNTGQQISEKVQDYLAAGTQAVWVVDPRQETVTVHLSDGERTTLGPSDTLNGAPALPGFHLPVTEIFDPSP